MSAVKGHNRIAPTATPNHVSRPRKYGIISNSTPEPPYARSEPSAKKLSRPGTLVSLEK
jgi:hypothetical protein